MKFILQKNGGSHLLILFLGWGMDGNVVRHLSVKNYDLLLCYSYHQGDSVDFFSISSAYEAVDMIGWSFGVFAAAVYARQVTFRHAAAVNGTLTPIDGDGGIPPDIFQRTLESWNEATRRKFFRRMCVDAETDHFFQSCPPERSCSDQKEELLFLQTLAADHPIADAMFDRAVIGTRDRIFSPEAQRNAWSNFPSVRQIQWDAPHYPFFQTRSAAGVFQL